MLDLLDIQPDVKDLRLANNIIINNGMIEFDNVCFKRIIFIKNKIIYLGTIYS